jgi:hypothetical protein
MERWAAPGRGLFLFPWLACLMTSSAKKVRLSGATIKGSYGYDLEKYEPSCNDWNKAVASGYST